MHHLALVLQDKTAKLNRNVQRNAAPMSLTRAKDIVYHQIIEGHKKALMKYKVEEAIDEGFLQTKPQGVRQGVLEVDDALWESSPEHEIFDAR